MTLEQKLDAIEQLLDQNITKQLQEIQNWKSTIAQPRNFDSGDTAWILMSSALVLFMSLPGLALFYGGMAQVKNVLSTVAQTLSIACAISVLWFCLGYSLAMTTATPVIGGYSRFWLMGEPTTARIGVGSVSDMAPTIPESVYFIYQMEFAIIAAAIVCGSFAGRYCFCSQENGNTNIICIADSLP